MSEDDITTIQDQISKIDSNIENLRKNISALLRERETLVIKKETLQKQINLLPLNKDHRQSSSYWLEKDFSWSKNIINCLQDTFKVQNFRPLQLETINATLAKKDCILVMPTGSGKSLCFQLPAVVSNGFTLVISPLVSLMEDQLIALQELKIDAAMLDASSPKAYITNIQNQMLSQNGLKLLYVTPERLAKSKRFMAKLEKAYSVGSINRIVIDEVHCASHWGHDFRPDYKYLGILKRQFPLLPILGLTATASKKVLDDIKDILNLKNDCLLFRGSFDRPNLFYEVKHTLLSASELMDDIATCIKSRFNKESGIVYCFSRKDSEEVSTFLNKKGINSHCYHADIPSDIKTKVHRLWIKGDIQVIVATIAFGMGIDKPNVRFVIHYSLSKSIENYYQESGRAGRDGHNAYCILYFRFQDIFRQMSMVFSEKTGLDKVYQMLRYCIEKKQCRRSIISADFEEVWKTIGSCNTCDNCFIEKSRLETRDFNQYGLTVVFILKSASGMDEKLTPLKLIDIWLGKGKSSLRPISACTLSREECEIVLSKLLLERVVQEEFHFTPYSTITYLVPGPHSDHLIQNIISIHHDFFVSNDIQSDKLSSTSKRKSIGKPKKSLNKKSKINEAESGDDFIMIDDSENELFV